MHESVPSSHFWHNLSYSFLLTSTTLNQTLWRLGESLRRLRSCQVSCSFELAATFDHRTICLRAAAMVVPQTEREVRRGPQVCVDTMASMAAASRFVGPLLGLLNVSRNPEIFCNYWRLLVSVWQLHLSTWCVKSFEILLRLIGIGMHRINVDTTSLRERCNWHSADVFQVFGSSSEHCQREPTDRSKAPATARRMARWCSGAVVQRIITVNHTVYCSIISHLGHLNHLSHLVCPFVLPTLAKAWMMTHAFRNCKTIHAISLAHSLERQMAKYDAPLCKML